MSQSELKITLYRWGGRKWFLEIRSGCEECDRSVQVIRQMLESEFRDAPVALEIKNWLDHLFKSLRHGGWHAPVVLVDGKLFSQGIVPDPEQLARRVRQRLEQTGAICPVCKNLVRDGEYYEHRRKETQQRILRFIERDHPEWVASSGPCLECLRLYEEKLKKGELIA